MEYEFKIVTEKEVRTYNKKSKYDPMLDAFIATKEKLIEVALKEDVEANYVRLQIDKRIKKRKIPIVVSVANNKLYLETPKVETPKKK
jgi:hypothetical protein